MRSILGSTHSLRVFHHDTGSGVFRKKNTILHVAFFVAAGDEEDVMTEGRATHSGSSVLSQDLLGDEGAARTTNTLHHCSVWRKCRAHQTHADSQLLRLEEVVNKVPEMGNFAPGLKYILCIDVKGVEQHTTCVQNKG